MQKPNFSQIYKLAFSTVLTFILGFIMSDIGLLAIPIKYYFLVGFAVSLFSAIGITQLLWIGVPKIVSLITSFFTTPKFSNVKISFLENNEGKVLVCVKNKEWRYPLAVVSAISGGDLNWIQSQKSHTAEIKKNEEKRAYFLSSIGDSFYIDVNNEQVEKLGVGNHKINIVFYIAFGKFRVARTYFLEVSYKGKKNISVANTIQLQDIPQTEEAWSIYESHKKLVNP